MDYRAFVSHTLCKQRFFLGLDTANSARRRLNDASVWPLLRKEALRLLDLSDSLFGLVSEALNEQVKVPLHKVLTSLDILGSELLGGQDKAFGDFRLSAEGLRDLLTSIPDIMSEHPPGFSEQAVWQYLGGKATSDWVAEFAGEIDKRLKPLVTAMIQSEHPVDEYYSKFWPMYSDIQLLYRTTIIAGAAKRLPAADYGPIRRARSELHRIERVVSCWSPSIDPAERHQKVLVALDAEGFSTVDSVIKTLNSIKGAL